VTFLYKYEAFLYIGFTNGVVEVVDTQYHQSGFEVALKVDNITEANTFIEKNIFLKAHLSYTSFNTSSFQIDLQIALNKLGQDLHAQALEQMKEHINDEQYQEFENYLKYSSEIFKFYTLISDRELAPAYIKVHELPLLKKTPAYARLEVLWHNIFNKAKKLLQEDAIGLYKNAQFLVEPFSKVPEKKYLVGHLFNNVDVFSKADLAIKEQNFKKYFAYVKEYEFLENTSLYDKVTKIGESSLENILDLENINRYDKLLNEVIKLSVFPMYQNELKEIVRRVNKKKEFDKAVMSKQYNKAFELIDKFEYIQALPKAIVLEARFQKDIELAQETTLKPKDILLMLKKYSNFNVCKERIASVMKYAYINEMYAYCKHDKIYWEEVFKRFISIYGEDISLKKFARISARYDIYERALQKTQFLGIMKSNLRPTLLIKKAS